MGRPRGSTTRTPTAELEDVILGLDIGSTSTRVCLFSPTSEKEVEVDAGHAGDYTRFEPGDFSTSCYPFDQGTTYIGNVIARDRIATSLKPVFLLLSDIDREELEPLVAEYPHSRELLSGMDPQSKNHKTFKRKLNTAVQYFFRFLKTQTLKVCENHNLRITAVGISVPGQWPSPVEDYMTDRFLEQFCGSRNSDVRFRVSRGDIFFHGETQALAHFFFKHYKDDPRVSNSENGVFVLADFGGQNLNVSTYQIGPGLASNSMTFFEMGYSRGVAGGSESQDYIVGEYCAYTLAQDGHQLTQSDKQALINDFHIKKTDLDSKHNAIQRGNAPHSNKIVLRGDEGTVVRLSPREVRHAFEEAMESPLRVLAEELDRAIRLTGHRLLQMIVAGGSARSLALQEKLRSMCRERNMRAPIFVEKIGSGIRDRSFKIAKGAAYATANNIPPDDFLRPGAGIGVQIREHGETVWNDTAVFLCNPRDRVTRTIELDDGDELKLICNPFLGESSTESISYHDAYDIYELGAFKNGTVKLDASFQRARAIPSLFLEMKWSPKGGSGPSAGKAYPGHLRLPLWFHRSSSCVLVKLDGVKGKLPVEALFKDGPKQRHMADSAISDQLSEQGEGSVDRTYIDLTDTELVDIDLMDIDLTDTDLTDTEVHTERQPPAHTPLASNVQSETPVASALTNTATVSAIAGSAMAATAAAAGHKAPVANMGLDGMDIDPGLVEANRWASCARQASEARTSSEGDERSRPYSKPRHTPSTELLRRPKRLKASREAHLFFKYLDGYEDD